MTSMFPPPSIIPKAYWPDTVVNRSLKFVLDLFKVLLILVVGYLSWRPSPMMEEIPWIPSFLGIWADEFVRARTAVPFVALGFLNGLTQVVRKAGIVDFARSALAYLGLAVVVELVQVFIPSRHCDVQDMLWAVLGTMLGQAPGLAYVRHQDKTL